MRPIKGERSGRVELGSVRSEKRKCTRKWEWGWSRQGTSGFVLWPCRSGQPAGVPQQTRNTLGSLEGSMKVLGMILLMRLEFIS